MHKKIIIAFFIKLCIAQGFILQETPGDSLIFRVKFIKPLLQSEQEITVPSGTYLISFVFPVTKNLDFTGTIPYTSLSIENDYPLDDTRSIQNVYLGIKNRLSRSNLKLPFQYEFGFYLPSAYRFSLQDFGIYADFYNFYAYAPEIMTLYTNFQTVTSLSSNVSLKYEMGPLLSFPNPNINQDRTISLHYGTGLVYSYDRIDITCELFGLVFIDGSDLPFKSNFPLGVAPGVTFSYRKIRIGLCYQQPIGHFFDRTVYGCAGLSVGYNPLIQTD